MLETFKKNYRVIIEKGFIWSHTWIHSISISTKGILTYWICLKVIPVMSKIMMQPLICVIGSNIAVSRLIWTARNSSFSENFSGVQSSIKKMLMKLFWRSCQHGTTYWLLIKLESYAHADHVSADSLLRYVQMGVSLLLALNYHSTLDI